MCLIVAATALFCFGTVGYASPLEKVAERRLAATWGGLSGDLNNSDVLIGVEDCSLLNYEGRLLIGQKSLRVKVVDCNQKTHLWPVGYLGDVNAPNLNYQSGWLILEMKKEVTYANNANGSGY